MRTEALIIKTQPTNEYDVLVTCYTPEWGKLTAVAKSALKHGSMQGMHLATLSLVDFELIEGHSLPIIAAAQNQQGYPNIKQSLERVTMAQFFLETVEKMVFDRQRDTHLWKFLTTTMDELNGTGGSWPWFRARQIAMLDVLGYAPQLDRCVRCDAAQSPAGWALSVELGGLVCSRCFIAGTKAVLLSHHETGLLQGQEKTTIPSTRSAVDTLFEYHAGSSFTSLQMLYALPLAPSPVIQ